MLPTTRGYAKLCEISPFSLLSESRRASLARTVRLCHYPRRAMIIDFGARPSAVYVLLDGRAKTAIEDAQGREMTLSLIEKNELFGDVELFEDGVTSSGVEALEPCEVLCIPRASFHECIRGDYGAAMAVLQLAEARLRKAHVKIAMLGLLDVYERVARVLVESAEQVNGQWIVATGAEEIARTVAASREMVSRVFKNMDAQGLVSKAKRKTVILDWPSMRAVCDR